MWSENLSKPGIKCKSCYGGKNKAYRPQTGIKIFSYDNLQILR